MKLQSISVVLLMIWLIIIQTTTLKYSFPATGIGLQPGPGSVKYVGHFLNFLLTGTEFLPYNTSMGSQIH
jgi:hypothetical protein